MRPLGVKRGVGAPIRNEKSISFEGQAMIWGA
jgi:hypothetical protein